MNAPLPDAGLPRFGAAQQARVACRKAVGPAGCEAEVAVQLLSAAATVCQCSWPNSCSLAKPVSTAAGVRRSLAAALHCLLAAGLVSATTMPAVVQPAAHSAAIPALRVAGLLQQQPQPQRRSLRASSPCPRGMRRVRPADRQRALESGRHVFAWHIQELCGRMPLHVTEPLRFGLRKPVSCTPARLPPRASCRPASATTAWAPTTVPAATRRAGMAPRCANAARTRFTLLLSYLSPCDGGRRVKYSLDVDWRPQRRCPADFWPLATYVEVSRRTGGSGLS